MCGIIGSIDLPFGQGVLDLLHHRGPDACGLEVLEVAGKRLTLGHRRLSIVDVSAAGHQPMATPDGRCWLVYNGEVYNHQPLREGLRDVRFRGHSDTETVLHRLARYGAGDVENINGIFGLAFLDIGKKRLYLIRDPYGVKPLYYRRSGEKFSFASEIRPLLQLEESELDRQRFVELLRLRYVPSPDTLFRGVKKVRPGHVLEVDFSGDCLGVKEYPFIQSPEIGPSMPPEEALERYGQLFEAAVRRQMMADVEVGVLLSGGVDSALVASRARRHAGGRLKGFTVGYAGGGEADEIEAARETAKWLDLDHVVTTMDQQDFFRTIAKVVSVLEEPIATASTIPMFYLSELASRDVKVVLSGQGADEMGGGYGRYQGEILRRAVPLVVPRWVQELKAVSWIKSDRIQRGLSSAAIVDDVDRFLKVYEVFSPEAISALTGLGETTAREKVQYFYELLECKRMGAPVERMMALDLRMNLPDDLLFYTDKITMWFSLECRVPILDLELAQFMESLPWQLRIRLGKGKTIHKRYAMEVLPQHIVRRKKKGFLSPTRTWFRDPHVREILLSSGTRFANLFDRSHVAKVLEELDKGFNRERQIFLLLGIYYWLEGIGHKVGD